MNTIRFTTHQFNLLKEYLFKFPKKEAAAYVLGGYFRNDEGEHFVAREIVFPQKKDYLLQQDIHLEISPIFFNKVISRAEDEKLCVLICHSHPWSKKYLDYSPSDDYGERESTKTLTECLEGKPVFSLLFGPNSIIGRFRLSTTSTPKLVHEIRLIDRHIEFIRTENSKKNNSKQFPDLFDRQLLVYGEQLQKKFQHLKVGIVGLGGTGSSVSEQLVRMGINNFIFVDNDKMASSNLTRVYGSYPKHIKRGGLPKVDVAKNNAKQISKKVKIEPIFDDVINQSVLTRLKNCDIIFCCTDKHAPRSVLNELCYQYFIPIIDIGVGLNTKNKCLNGGTIRVSLISPSLPCLFCLSIIRPEVIATEYLPESEKQEQFKKGYIQNVTPLHAPSVISFTTAATGIGVNLFLDLFCRYIEGNTSTFYFDLAHFSMNRLTAPIGNQCACVKRFGRGDFMPLSAP